MDRGIVEVALPNENYPHKKLLSVVSGVVLFVIGPIDGAVAFLLWQRGWLLGAALVTVPYFLAALGLEWWRDKARELHMEAQGWQRIK